MQREQCRDQKCLAESDFLFISSSTTFGICRRSALLKRLFSYFFLTIMVRAGGHEVPTHWQHVACGTLCCHKILAEAVAQLHHHDVLLCDGRFRHGRCVCELPVKNACPSRAGDANTDSNITSECMQSSFTALRQAGCRKSCMTSWLLTGSRVQYLCLCQSRQMSRYPWHGCCAT